MTELGLTLAWLAVQVSLVLVPGLILYAMAARRGPAAGASIATLGLGMVVVLSVAAFLPGIGCGWGVAPGRHGVTSPAIPVAAPSGDPVLTEGHAPGRPSGERWLFAGWRGAWDRFERGAAEPAARCRPWAEWLAPLFLAGAAAGLLRMAMGLVAVVACRLRGRPVDDPGMLGLLDALRRAIGCRPGVELREVPDLVGPATAGWIRPAILLPEDWRSWDDAERRAVMAHELAHVVRCDCAAGLIARLALALNGYHPMVWWLAGRLRLQQELAADAIGARLAGGRVGYLVALSRMALRHDGRSPWWPARAFLPARGTLIRRITMLRDENRMAMVEGPCSRAGRLAITATLVGLTAAVLTLRGPARVGAEEKPPTSIARPVRPDDPPLFAREGMDGVVVFRPSAIARYVDVERLVLLLLEQESPGGFDAVARKIRVDTKRPGFLKLGAADLEWFTCWFAFGRGRPVNGQPTHTIKFGWTTLRTVRPFDWRALLLQWKLDLVEVREGGGIYYKVAGPSREILGEGCIYLPDDRTIVMDDENIIRKRIRGEVPPTPPYLRGLEWERACHDLAAIALDNRDGMLSKDYHVGDALPGDVIVLSLLRSIDRFIVSVDDADPIVLRGWAALVGAGASREKARSIQDLVNQGRIFLDRLVSQTPPGDVHEDLYRTGRAFLANLRVEHDDRSIGVRSEGFATLGALLAILQNEARTESEPNSRARSPKAAKPLIRGVLSGNGSRAWVDA
jgi:hypothetical protein